MEAWNLDERWLDLSGRLRYVLQHQPPHDCIAHHVDWQIWGLMDMAHRTLVT